MMELPLLVMKSRASWRAWLAERHHLSKGVWLVFFKPKSGKTGVSYDEALEEALCFGWIDSIIKRIDDDRYVRKFIPRTNAAKWSAVNIERARKLVKNGMMTDAGLRMIDRGLLEGTKRPPRRPGDGNPESAPEFLNELKRHPKAMENFLKLAPSSKKLYAGWIMSAKKEETRKRRLAEAVEKLSRGEKLGMK